MRYNQNVSRKLAREKMAFKTGNYVLLAENSTWTNPSRYMVALFAHECAINKAESVRQVSQYIELANRSQE